MAGEVLVHSCLMRVGLITWYCNSRPTDEWILAKLDAPFPCAYASCIKLSGCKKYVCLADTTGSLSCTHPLAPFEIQTMSCLFIPALIRDLISSTNCIRWMDEMVYWPIINSVHSCILLHGCWNNKKTGCGPICWLSIMVVVQAVFWPISWLFFG